MWMAALLASAMALAHDPARDGVAPEVTILACSGGQAVVLPHAAVAIGYRDRLLLTVRGRVIGYGRAETAADGFPRAVPAAGAAGRFRIEAVGSADANPPPFALGVRAWLIPGDLAARVAGDWPTDARWFDSLDTIGPGTRTVWLETAGPALPAGTSWLAREKAQPCARLEAVFSTADLTCCRVIPLVDDVRLRTGARVLRWPGPGMGAPQTYAAFAESLGDVQRVWIALPPRDAETEGAATGPRPAQGAANSADRASVDLAVNPWSEQRVDFYRGARYIAHGVVERQDARFGYVRTERESSAEPVQVGDRAVLRTPADLAAGRRSARLFFASSRALINAGESDGIMPGSVATVMRAGRAVGVVRVERVQSGYATVARVEEPGGSEGAAGVQAVDGEAGERLVSGEQPAGSPSAEPFQPLDEVYFAPPPPAPAPIGRIARVEGEVFIAHVAPAFRCHVGVPLAIEQADGLICAVGIMVSGDELEGSEVMGVLVPESIVELPAPGARLLLPPRKADALSPQLGALHSAPSGARVRRSWARVTNGAVESWAK